MLDRNEAREIFLNDHPIYKKLLTQRGVKVFRHYGRAKFGRISVEEIENLTIVDHIWKTGDALAKLSFKYYGDPRYWWVLGWFNKKPIDNFYKVGTVVHIPLPLEEILYYAGREKE